MSLKLLKILEQSKIIWKCDENDKYHPLLTSGLHSNIYVNTTRLIESPVLTNMFLREYVTNSIIARLQNCDYLVGIESCGIPIAYMLPMIFPKLSVPRIIFVKKEGFYDSYWSDLNGKVIFVDDIVTTGGTLAKILATTRRSNIKVNGIFCLFNRSGQSFVFTKGKAIPIISCFDLKAESWHPSDCPLCEKGSKPISPKKHWSNIQKHDT